MRNVKILADPYARLLMEMVHDSMSLIRIAIKGGEVVTDGNKVRADKFLQNEIHFLFGDDSCISFSGICSYLGEDITAKRREIKRELGLKDDTINEFLAKKRTKVFNDTSDK